MMCPECESFLRGESGHRSLIEDAAPDLRFGHGTSHYLRRYSCLVCGTQWKYEHDRNNPSAGWSLQQQAELET